MHQKLGGTLEDIQLFKGVLFTDKMPISAPGSLSKVVNPKIALLQFCISSPKTNMENNVVISDYSQIDQILKEERLYIMKIVKQIVKSGANVVLIQKSILRDAVNDLAIHYLTKNKIMVLKDIERTDVPFIC
jgi:T-complex protein 1 subunit delta